MAPSTDWTPPAAGCSGGGWSASTPIRRRRPSRPRRSRSEPGSDALVVATAHNELLRLEGATGRREVALRRRRALRRQSRHRRRQNPGRHPQRQVDHHRRRLGRIEGLHPVPAAARRRSGRRWPPVADLPGRLAHQPLHPFARSGRLQARRLPRPRGGEHHHRAGDVRRLPVGRRSTAAPRRRVAGVHDRAESTRTNPTPWLKLVQEIPLDGHLADVAAGRGTTRAGHHQLRRCPRLRAQRHRREKPAARSRADRHRRRRKPDAIRRDAERPVLDRRQPADRLRRAGGPRPVDAQVGRLRR